jgi:glycosylphosphatidylinositol transamidase
MFLAIGKYLPSAVIVGIAMEICGLHGWVGSGWEQVSADSLQEKASGLGIATDGPRWKRRKRPVLEALGVMLGTHAIGLLIFLLATSKYIIGNLNVRHMFNPFVPYPHIYFF